jgi:hypothetical protein
LKPKINTKSQHFTYSQSHPENQFDQYCDEHTQQTDDKIDTDCQSSGEEDSHESKEIQTPHRERFFSADHADDSGLIQSADYPVKISSCANQACLDAGDT